MKTTIPASNLLSYFFHTQIEDLTLHETLKLSCTSAFFLVPMEVLNNRESMLTGDFQNMHAVSASKSQDARPSIYNSLQATMKKDSLLFLWMRSG